MFAIKTHTKFITFLASITYIPILCLATPQEYEILNRLSLDQKIGQLFIVAAAANGQPLKKSIHTEEEIIDLIKLYHIGGIIYLGSSSAEQLYGMTQRIKNINRLYSPLELWVGLDAEWGPNMRIDNVIKFPYNLTLGAVKETQLLHELGYIIGQQLKYLGVSINFAPVVDINTNPNNPVINRRSFGQEADNVTQKAVAFARGIAQAGIMACAKHFPGHGDTDVDSHSGLPIISHTQERIQAIELSPFDHLIRNNIPAIMVGHLVLPAFDYQLPATLSYALTTELLKKQLHFDGLVITDALDMHGATLIYQPGLIELHALKAGADLLLVPIDLPSAHNRIKKAILDGTLSLQELDEHLLKIIHAKILYANHDESLPETIIEQLNNKQAQELSRKLYQKAITIVRDQQNIIPVPQQERISVVHIGETAPSVFQNKVAEGAPTNICLLSTSPTRLELQQAFTAVKETPIVIVGLSGLTYQSHNNFGISQKSQDFIKGLQERGHKIGLCLFGNPYALRLFKDISTIVEAYEDHPFAQEAAASVLLGRLKAEGLLPITP